MSGDRPDLVIAGGAVVDGTGAPAVTADVVVDGGRIVEIGRWGGRARHRIDADGLVVTPGFVDLHTHFDAQVQWDPTLSPSMLHGVTTAFGGNCGFTVAPLSGDGADAAYVARMLSRVEGIPLASLEAAVTWDWRGFGEWLDRIDGNLGPNVGFLVGHSTLRRLVMGDEATVRAATAAEIDAMASLLDAALAEGGFGLSSSWIETHTDGDGAPVPSRAATAVELLALAAVVGRHEGTTLEFVPGLGPFGDEQVTVMARLSATADRPLNWNILRAEHDHAEHNLATYDRAAALGGAVVALTPSEPMRLRATLSTGVLFANLPGWAEVLERPVAERLALLADPAVRRRLQEAVDAAGPLKWPMSALAAWSDLTIGETSSAANRGATGRTVGELAAERGVAPLDALLDVALADGLQTYFTLPSTGDDQVAWSRRARLWRDHRTIVGGADAGAHMDMMCGSSYTTSLLGEGVRDRGLLPLEEAVHALSGAPARLYGLVDRGRLGVGCHADVVVLDPATVAAGPLQTVADLPGGARRLFSRPVGIEHVFVAGVEVARRGEDTGARPGRVLRPGVDTRTVDVATILGGAAG